MGKALGTGFSFFAAVAAHASVTGIGIWHIRTAEQTGMSALAYESARISAWIDTSSTNQVSSANLLVPSGATYAMAPAESKEAVGFSSLGSSWSAIEAKFPGGNYKFQITNGLYSGTSATIAVPNPLPYPSSQPLLTPASYKALQSVDPAKTIRIVWGAWTAGSTHICETFFDLTDLTAQKPALKPSQGSNTNFLGIDIPAGTLLSGHKYAFSISFDAYNTATLAAFGGCEGSDNFACETTGTFVVP